MNKVHTTWKRVTLYVLGLFILALGVSISIQADLGVSPVSSLAYALSLTSGLSVGMMTILANILFIVMQIIFQKRVEVREFIVQLIIGFLFGFYMDATLFLLTFIPTPNNFLTQFSFLAVSLFIVAAGLLGYFVSKFPLMPYDALTHVISERFKLEFSKAKIFSDLMNVCISGAICLIFTHSFGAVGIGTVIAAYFIGKILGWYMKYLKPTLENWLQDHQNGDKHDVNNSSCQR